MTNPNPTVVRVLEDGTCYIDDEPYAVPPGVPINSAVLTRLQMEASALDGSVYAVVHDATSSPEPLLIQVNADGTSVPWAPESAGHGSAPQATTADQHDDLPVPKWIAMDRPFDALPEPYRGALAAICASARPDNLAPPSHAADNLLIELSNRLRPDHWCTVLVGQVRADLAWLTGDLSGSLQAWLYAARAWHASVGADHPMARLALGNAVGCWRRMSDREALPWGDSVIAMLQQAGHRDLATARSRVAQLTTRQGDL